MINKSLKICFIVMITFVFAACQKQIEVISSSELQAKLKESVQHSSVSWWYEGENEEYYFLSEEKPLMNNKYQISKKFVFIKIDQEKRFSNTESKPRVNLKIPMIDIKTY